MRVQGVDHRAVLHPASARHTWRLVWPSPRPGAGVESNYRTLRIPSAHSTRPSLLAGSTDDSRPTRTLRCWPWTRSATSRSHVATPSCSSSSSTGATSTRRRWSPKNKGFRAAGRDRAGRDHCCVSDAFTSRQTLRKPSVNVPWRRLSEWRPSISRSNLDAVQNDPVPRHRLARTAVPLGFHEITVVPTVGGG